MNNIKCPFCNRNLHKGEYGIYSHLDYMTECKGRLFDGSKELWQALIDTKKKLDIAMDGLKRIEKLTEPSYKNRNLEALALAVNTFSGEIIEQINQRNNNA